MPARGHGSARHALRSAGGRAVLGGQRELIARDTQDRAPARDPRRVHCSQAHVPRRSNVLARPRRGEACQCAALSRPGSLGSLAVFFCRRASALTTPTSPTMKQDLPVVLEHAKRGLLSIDDGRLDVLQLSSDGNRESLLRTSS